MNWALRARLLVPWKRHGEPRDLAGMDVMDAMDGLEVPAETRGIGAGPYE